MTRSASTLPLVISDAAVQLVQRFKACGRTLAVAESCTGGMLAMALTDVPGASAVFTHGWVTYANAAKACCLAVPADLITTHGAVSEIVARSMAEGARRIAGSTHAIAITGIAGPDGGTAEKPVGTVFIADADADGIRIERHQFTGSRLTIRLASVQAALQRLLKPA